MNSLKYNKSFTYHIVDIKLIYLYLINFLNLFFTYHIVDIKLGFPACAIAFGIGFTYHIVDIKPQNKLSISNVYTYTMLLKLQ